MVFKYYHQKYIFFLLFGVGLYLRITVEQLAYVPAAGACTCFCGRQAYGNASESQHQTGSWGLERHLHAVAVLGQCTGSGAQSGDSLVDRWGDRREGREVVRGWPRSPPLWVESLEPSRCCSMSADGLWGSGVGRNPPGEGRGLEVDKLCLPPLVTVSCRVISLISHVVINLNLKINYGTAFCVSL